MMTRDAFRGVLGFPVTPFRQDLSLDLDALGRNVDEMASHPFCALVAAGGMGEVYSLSADEIVEVTRVTVAAARGRMPVMAGTGFNAAVAGDIARRAEQAGAACLLVLPPYYINAPESGLAGYYTSIANATGLPLILYGRDWCAPAPPFLARLAERLPSFVAWKDGQGDMRRLQAIRAAVGDRLAWVGGAGDDLVPAYYAMGLRAFTSSVANVSPRLALDLHEAASRGDRETLQRLGDELIVPLYALRARGRGYEVSVMKELMNLLGLAGGTVRPPLTPLLQDDRAALEALLARWQHL